MWDCEKCGCQSILDLANCPMCGAPRPATNVPAASVTPAAVSTDSLAGEAQDGTDAVDDPEPQAPKLEPEDQVEPEDLKKSKK